MNEKKKSKTIVKRTPFLSQSGKLGNIAAAITKEMCMLCIQYWTAAAERRLLHRKFVLSIRRALTRNTTTSPSVERIIHPVGKLAIQGAQTHHLCRVVG